MVGGMSKAYERIDDFDFSKSSGDRPNGRMDQAALICRNCLGDEATTVHFTQSIGKGVILIHLVSPGDGLDLPSSTYQPAGVREL